MPPKTTKTAKASVEETAETLFNIMSQHPGTQFVLGDLPGASLAALEHLASQGRIEVDRQNHTEPLYVAYPHRQEDSSVNQSPQTAAHLDLNH